MDTKKDNGTSFLRVSVYALDQVLTTIHKQDLPVSKTTGLRKITEDGFS